MFGKFLYIQFYKNSDIREYQDQLAKVTATNNHTNQDILNIVPIMKMHLQGGSAQPLGRNCIPVTSLRQHSIPASCSLPKPQDLTGNKANKIILDACSFSQAFSMFAPPLHHPPGDNDWLEYLGEVYASELHYLVTPLDKVQQDVEYECKLNGKTVEEEFFNHSYKLEKHCEVELKPVDIDYISANGRVMKPEKVMININSSLGKMRLPLFIEDYPLHTNSIIKKHMVKAIMEGGYHQSLLDYFFQTLLLLQKDEQQKWKVLLIFP